MANITYAINSFIMNEIKLSGKDVQSAVSSREWFLTRIENEIKRRNNEPSLYSGPLLDSPFVRFGSYFKGTKVSNVDEFDILVVIDSRSGYFSIRDKHYGTGEGSANPNHKYDAKYKKSDDSGVSPRKILNWLKDVVKTVTDAYDGTVPDTDKQAITARIESKDLSIDLVPAGIFTRDTDKSVFYNIPRGDKENGWIVTSPRDDIELLASVAKDKDRFRDIIRLCKYIRTAYNFLVPSFAIESGVVQYGQNYRWKDNLYVDLYYALWYLEEKFKEGKIPAPYDSTNLLAGISSLEWYAERLSIIRNEMTKLTKENDQTAINEKITALFKNERTNH